MEGIYKNKSVKVGKIKSIFNQLKSGKKKTVN